MAAEVTVAVEVTTQGDFLELVHRFDKLERRLMALEQGLAGLSETVDTRTAARRAVAPTRDDPVDVTRDVIRIPTVSVPALGGALGALRPFRASPHAKDQILTSGGRVFLALYDSAPEVREAVVAALNGALVSGGTPES